MDKYYTKDNISKQCIELIKKHLIIDYENDLIIEPSAGNGSFIKYIKELSKNYIFIDIEPENNEIIKEDYLIYKVINNYNNIHVIGNPPFGKQSSLCLKFIKKSAEFAKSISFILPRSFKKDTLQNKIPLNYHLILNIDLDDNAFYYIDKDFKIPCVFQIWEKRNYNRTKAIQLNANKFIFVKKDDNPDISIRRVGFYAGKVDINYLDKNIQTHYFIKFDKDINIKDIFPELEKIKYETNNTVGAKSISKQDIIKQFNIVIDNFIKLNTITNNIETLKI